MSPIFQKQAAAFLRCARWLSGVFIVLMLALAPVALMVLAMRPERNDVRRDALWYVRDDYEALLSMPPDVTQSNSRCFKRDRLHLC